MIATPIIASTTNEALKDIVKAKQADLIELRLDFIKDINEINLEKLIKKTKKQVIVTDRKDRLNLIKKAIELKANLIDIDISKQKIIKKIIKQNKKNTKLIFSHHNFKRTNQKEIIKKYNKIKKSNPDIIKIATFANSINDNILILNLIKKAKKENKKIIALCMGEKGKISRILSPTIGAELTFGSLERGKESAPGQLTAKTLRNIYRIDKLKNPKIFGLVGNPVNHSKGFIFHNKEFQKNKQNKIYINFLVDDLKKFIKNYKELVSGLSITIPYKRDIIKHLDKVEPTSKKIGAVNTVIKVNNKLIGLNTDLTGAIKSIESKTKIKNKKVLMIGAGGVARAIAFGIVRKGGKLLILNRTLKKAKKLAKELKCKAAKLNIINKLKDIDIIINATSIGMHPKINQTPIKKEILRKIINKKTLVFDSVYTPRKTKLLKDSKNLSCNIIDGYEMFINQAKEQSRLFRGTKKWN